MKIESDADSSENLYYTYNVTTNLLDLTSYEEEVRTEKAKTFFPLLILTKFVNSILKTSTLTIVLSWDVFCFALAYLVFIKEKTLSLVDFLNLSKYRLVRFLMWRRGVLFRPATHGGVLALAALAVIAGGIFSKAEIAAQDLATDNAVIAIPNTPETIVPVGRPRSEVISYSVSKGDTLSTIAKTFGVSVDSVKWANNKIDDTIKAGQTLKIPPVSGIVHKVNKGETLAKIAKKYSADAQTIADYPFNYLDASMSLQIGQALIVPGGSIPKPVASPYPSRPAPAYIPSGNGILGWPVPGGGISQYASWWHPAIDIAAPYGTPIYSAAGGRVIVSVKQGYGFGWYIVIDHGNGMTSTYAHMSALYANVGDNVSRGQLIGAIGTTGYSTGPHLHFVVTQGGQTVNPLSLLP